MNRPSQPSQIMDKGISDSQLFTVDPQQRIMENIRLLWDSRGLFLRCAVIAFCAVLAIAFLAPAQYQSTTLLMPPDQPQNSNMPMLSALAGDAFGLNIAANLLGKSSGELFVGILRSRSVSDDVINRFDLKRVYWLHNYDQVRKKLTSRTDISEDPKSGIISISVTDRDRERAAAMAQFYVDDLNRLVAQLSTSSAHRERVFLEQRLEAVKADLDAAAIEFSQFASKTTAIDIPEQDKAIVESTARLQGELMAARSELSGVEEIYSENNVRVRSLRARISELQRQLERLGGKYAGVQGRTTQGDASVYPSIRELPLLGVTYADLDRRVKTQEAVFRILTEEYNRAKIEEVKEIPTVRVLDPANVPQEEFFPPRFALAGVASMLVTLTAIVWVLTTAYWSGLDAGDPAKVLFDDVVRDIKTYRSQALGLLRMYVVNRKRL
jgi:uncharacterized protein involved in exopolysaccharide biosynthesis